MIYIIITCLALLLGSFFYNWSSRQINSIQSKKGSQKSITKGHSVCDHCGHQLLFVDLIPIIGFVLRQGRCHYCHKNISRYYPMSEIALVLIFFMLYHRYDLLFSHYYQIPLLVLAICYLYSAAWVDALTGMIPDILNFSAVFLALLYRLSFGISHAPHIAYSVAILVGLVLLCYLSREQLWGQGDNIYLFSISLILPYSHNIFWVIAISSWIAVLFLLIKNKFNYKTIKGSKVHYSPYLFLAMLVFIYIYPYKLLW
jgi:prepilin signal peptidase PulO-like enzyme (type II secretory pathway)